MCVCMFIGTSLYLCLYVSEDPYDSYLEPLMDCYACEEILIASIKVISKVPCCPHPVVLILLSSYCCPHLVVLILLSSSCYPCVLKAFSCLVGALCFLQVVLRRLERESVVS